MADEFIKTTGTGPRLSGAEKAAILLGEIGWDNSEELKKALSESDIKKINRAMKKMNRQQSGSSDYGTILASENKVLAEAYNFGLRRNICKPVEFTTSENQTVKSVKETAAANPKAIAEFLSQLLKEDK